MWTHNQSQAVTAGTTSDVPVRFGIGDRVEVLQASRLPLEVSRGQGLIDAITGTEDEPLYWVAGFPMARTAHVLRLIAMAR